MLTCSRKNIPFSTIIKEKNTKDKQQKKQVTSFQAISYARIYICLLSFYLVALLFDDVFSV